MQIFKPLFNNHFVALCYLINSYSWNALCNVIRKWFVVRKAFKSVVIKVWTATQTCVARGQILVAPKL